MSHQKPYIDPSLFTKPPPNFNKNNSSKWNNFKVPTSPIANNTKKKPPNLPNNNSRTNTHTSRNYPTNSQSTSRNYATHSDNQSSSCGSPTQTGNYQSDSQNFQARLGGSQNVQSRPSGSLIQTGSSYYTNSPQSSARNYQTTPPPNIVRNFKNEPPPNYKVQHTAGSPESQYKDLVFNPIGLIPAQPFKPNVPPPKIQKSPQSPQYEMNVKANPATLQAPIPSATTLEEAKANYYMQMLYRYRQVADYSQSVITYSTAPAHPPPPNYPPPQQPPLPPGAPPRKPPPPPSTPSQSGSSPGESKKTMRNYQNQQREISPRASSPMSIQNQQMQNQQIHNQQMQNQQVQNQQMQNQQMQNQQMQNKQMQNQQMQNQQMQNQQMQNQPPMGNYHSRMPRPFTVYKAQFNKPVHYNLKRKFEGNVEQKKAPKKKKKPLSQVVPQKMNWSMEVAKKALDVEKECNKRSKRQGLIIKFPDQELNRDIVNSFHTSIESVHFQQPSTPRYCFVTLMDSADPETVIRHINQIPFGLGYLTAEHKKDREDEQNIRPCDIDPLTLYVGNLAQEITKDDVMKMYPKQKRIDIGYAKKMKYTRYAFVSFYNVDDAIEAFKKTHSSQMYSKSLIVRFRRLHGTVGLPGESRLQNAQRSAPENGSADPVINHDAWDIDVSNWYNEDPQTPDTRPLSEDEDDEDKKMPHYIRPRDFGAEHFDASYTYVPRNVTIKEEINVDAADANGYQDSDYGYGESDDQYSNVSNPLTPETTDHHDEAEPVTKQEQIKEEDYYPHRDPIRFRILPDTVIAANLQPSSTSPDLDPITSRQPNIADNSASVKQEDDDTCRPDTGIPSNIVIQNIEANALMLPVPIVIKKEQEGDESDTEIPRNIEVENVDANTLIVPAPIVIKAEQEGGEDSDTEVEADRQSGNDNSSNSLDLQGSSIHDGCDKGAGSKDRSDELRDSLTKDSGDTQPTMSGGLENSSERCDDVGFDWDIGANYPISDIKAELDFDDPAGDDNSSDEELDIHDILKKQKKVTKERDN